MKHAVSTLESRPDRASGHFSRRSGRVHPGSQSRPVAVRCLYDSDSPEVGRGRPDVLDRHPAFVCLPHPYEYHDSSSKVPSSTALVSPPPRSSRPRLQNSRAPAPRCPRSAKHNLDHASLAGESWRGAALATVMVSPRCHLSLQLALVGVRDGAMLFAGSKTTQQPVDSGRVTVDGGGNGLGSQACRAMEMVVHTPFFTFASARRGIFSSRR